MKRLRLNGLSSTPLYILGFDHWDEAENACLGKHRTPSAINSLKYAKLPPLIFQDLLQPANRTTMKNNGNTGDF